MNQEGAAATRSEAGVRNVRPYKLSFSIIVYSGGQFVRMPVLQESTTGLLTGSAIYSKA
jgi:hypothetical protein